MTPPRERREWYAGLPFRQVDEAWRTYMIRTSKNPALAEPFLSFRDGPNLHELAHLICAPDVSVLDPMWGVPFSTPFDEDGFGSPLEYRLELEVITVQEVIESYWERQDYPIPYTVGLLLSGFARKQAGYTRRAARAMSAAHLSKWTIEAIWKELCRKKEVVEMAVLAM